MARSAVSHDKDVLLACRANSVPRGTYGNAQELKALGFQVIGVGSDVSFFASGMKAGLSDAPTPASSSRLTIEVANGFRLGSDKTMEDS
jgi:hypothetical protein